MSVCGLLSTRARAIRIVLMQSECLGHQQQRRRRQHIGRVRIVCPTLDRLRLRRLEAIAVRRVGHRTRRSVYGVRSGQRRPPTVAGEDATVVRISWVCGRHGNNMVKTSLRLVDDGVSPSFVTDQVGHPTIVGDLVPMVRRLRWNAGQGCST